MRRIALLVAYAAALLAVGGQTALAGAPPANPCATGTLASGTYSGFTVSGTCNVAFNAQVTVHGNLRIADGGVFGGIIPSSVHVTGDVNVGRGALLGLGYATQTDVVDGSVDANRPLSLYLGFVTVHGDVTSIGGGTSARFYNFPIKDNTIDGNLTLHGWTRRLDRCDPQHGRRQRRFLEQCERGAGGRSGMPVTPRARSRPAALRLRAVTRTRPR